mmetsp:Transcript_59905/g.125244  ORF Transcript_59905/g.125244 Transcript_59905/m.125244 type:complete len:179 (-) Transcript_59905:160-696(-)
MFRPPRSIPRKSAAAVTALCVIFTISWVCVLFSEADGDAELVSLEDSFLGQPVTTQLAFDATTESASWPETRNPLKDFDADFLDGNKKAERGFPRSSASAEWAFTKNPLLGFDGGFKDSWNGWKGPEHNVWTDLPPEYPFLETKQSAAMKELGYKKWAGSGTEPEHNVFGKDYKWPDY